VVGSLIRHWHIQYQWLGGYLEAFLKHLPSAGLPRNTGAYASRLAVESLSQAGAFVQLIPPSAEYSIYPVK